MSQLLNSLKQAKIVESVVPYSKLDDGAKELLREAFNVRQRAYSPYSDFKVGAAFLATDINRGNLIFTGCNVENAAFTPTSCAERTAVTKAISEGYQQFASAAVVAFKPNEFTTPCGVCRQFIREFAHTDIPIYIAQAIDERAPVEPFSSDDPVFCTSIFNLLPHSFRTYKVV